ncbi:hypothetical protein ACH79_33405 [Bradyrhizobium sp. CCBAU 051011]|uniref:hypothetical protein n=1 Tax=Bradyrhizobium sp. CCBAU 051011 TaxID=858422 RepID=UPI0013741D87|nr:hypothetical protein [Bradyrhizobium sp. CCBAU 051011]QHO76803.1 hypothetical protein ACH79_33405 [Bradyrhizobium sp. CCBAU 051011]
MSRGGAGRGQGRKPVLEDARALLVGEHCENLWLAEAEDQAIERHNATPEGRMIAAEQERAQMIPVLLRRRSREALDDIHESINEIIDPENPEQARRGMSLPTQRPYGAKKVILEKAAAWCEGTFGIAITPNKADECWDHYRRVVAHAARKV